MKWFRQGPPPHQTALAMVGAKSGQQIVVLGARDGGLAAALALVTGLNGRTLVVDRSADAQRAVETAAAEAGALVDFERAPVSMLPVDPGTFDVVVVQHELTATPADPARILMEASRVVRGGGRIIVMEDAPRPGLLGVLKRPSHPVMDSGIVRDLLSSAGMRAVRVLAETDGIVYVEAMKPKETS